MPELICSNTRARDSGKDINLGSGGWYGVANNGTNIWFYFMNLIQKQQLLHTL